MDPFIGQIMMFGGNFAPRGWATCDGQLLAISQNSALFSILGTTYGGDGRTTFGLPDLRGRCPMHVGTGPGLTTRRLGEKTGSETVTLNVNQMPSHNHTVAANSATATTNSPVNTFPGGASAEGGSSKVFTYDTSAGANQFMNTGVITHTGGSQAHNNMAPVQVVTFVIALVGIFPSRN